MEIIPAIDLRGGRAVRLLRGEYERETVYYENPAEAAALWQAGGAPRIHLVDLDGARDGAVANREALRRIRETVDIPTQLGGGLRDLETVAFALDELGVDRAILGSVLLEDPGLARRAAERYPGRIVLGIDARGGRVATRGWRETSEAMATDLVREFDELPIAAVIYTDIARDGTLEGPNLEAQAEMAAASPFPVIASGGIGSLMHIRSLAELARSEAGGNIAGVIVGKALYEKKFTLPEAVKAAQT